MRKKEIKAKLIDEAEETIRSKEKPADYDGKGKTIPLVKNRDTLRLKKEAVKCIESSWGRPR